GESAPFSISVIGSDLDADDRVGAKIVEVLQHLPGSGNVRLTVPPREAELHVELLPSQLAANGLQAADVLESLNAAYHGTVAAELKQADRSVPGAVRIAGGGADQVGFARAARKAVAEKVALPAGVYLRYGGAAEAQAAAARELLLHSAAAFVLIVLLLALAFGSSRHVLLVLLALPSTLIGGVAAVAVTGGTLTLGAMVGFVALFGMAARNTILLVSPYDPLGAEEHQPWTLATSMRGAEG